MARDSGPRGAHDPDRCFLAAAILVELFEDSDRERLRGPIHRIASGSPAAVQIAAVIILGPWSGALVAAVGVARGRPLPRHVAARAPLRRERVRRSRACVGGLVFELAGGDVGSLQSCSTT